MINTSLLKPLSTDLILGGSEQAHVIIDTLGYFYPREAVATRANTGLGYIPLAQPCRIVNTGGINQAFHYLNRKQQGFLAWGTAPGFG